MAMRLANTADALTQLFNAALIPGAAHTNANESTSGRCYRMGVLEGDLDWLKWMRRIDWFFEVVCVEFEHCEHAYYKDLARAQAYLERHKGYSR